MPGSDPLRRRVLGIALGWTLVAAGVGAAPLPDEPLDRGAVLLPGRLPWGPSALPTGEILAPCEDQTVSVLDAGAVVSRWTAPGRIAGPVSVAPRGPTQLLVVPEGSGRFDVLVWDAQTRTLAQAWATQRAHEPAAAAWGATGTLYLVWVDGHAEAWSPRGQRLWEAETATGATQALVDEGLGLFVLGRSAVLLDGRGRETGRWPLPAPARGVLQTLDGRLYCWSDAGVSVQGPETGPFTGLVAAGDVLGVVVDRQDRVIVTFPGKVVRYGANGVPGSTVLLPRPAVRGAVLDDRGRYLVATTAGLEEWSYDGRLLAILDASPLASAPVVTDQGTAAWGGEDWRVHFATGFRLPPFGWAQDGGGPAKAFSARRPASVAVRAVNWVDDPEFGYFFELAASGDEAKQGAVLDQLTAFAARGLLARRPWANVVLLKIARSGLVDLQTDRSRVTNNWPGNRLRAYALLAQTAGPEDRDELVTVLAKEFDPAVAAQGVRALARSGWDGDGKLLRLMADLQSKMPTQAVVADAVVDAARDLWTTNGRSTDPVLVPLVTAVYQGPFPRSVKIKAQRFFQDLINGS